MSILEMNNTLFVISKNICHKDIERQRNNIYVLLAGQFLNIIGYILKFCRNDALVTNREIVITP